MGEPDCTVHGTERLYKRGTYRTVVRATILNLVDVRYYNTTDTTKGTQLVSRVHLRAMLYMHGCMWPTKCKVWSILCHVEWDFWLKCIGVLLRVTALIEILSNRPVRDGSAILKVGHWNHGIYEEAGISPKLRESAAFRPG